MPDDRRLYQFVFGQLSLGKKDAGILFAGNHTCSVADFYGTMKGPMKIPDGKIIPASGKGFHVEFCTVASLEQQRGSY